MLHAVDILNNSKYYNLGLFLFSSLFYQRLAIAFVKTIEKNDTEHILLHSLAKNLS